jgi:hypothetical protein
MCPAATRQTLPANRRCNLLDPETGVEQRQSGHYRSDLPRAYAAQHVALSRQLPPMDRQALARRGVGGKFP